MKKTLICCALLASVLSPAHAFFTVGVPDCGQWIKSPNNNHKAWLMGYMSGMSAMHTIHAPSIKDPLEQLSSAEQMFLWMDNYCRANPLKQVDDGAIQLWSELLSKTRPRR